MPTLDRFGLKYTFFMEGEDNINKFTVIDFFIARLENYNNHSELFKYQYKEIMKPINNYMDELLEKVDTEGYTPFPYDNINYDYLEYNKVSKIVRYKKNFLTTKKTELEDIIDINEFEERVSRTLFNTNIKYRENYKWDNTSGHNFFRTFNAYIMFIIESGIDYTKSIEFKECLKTVMKRDKEFFYHFSNSIYNREFKKNEYSIYEILTFGIEQLHYLSILRIVRFLYDDEIYQTDLGNFDIEKFKKYLKKSDNKYIKKYTMEQEMN
jgi:hypothetical protein